MSEPVVVAESGGVLTITLSRPEKANALSAEMADGVMEGLDRARTIGARAIVLRGEGRHF
ncbi:MAG: enoyl-CoA hydratase-related protein [Alphaproteobacteria bacterium]